MIRGRRTIRRTFFCKWDKEIKKKGMELGNKMIEVIMNLIGIHCILE